MYTVAEGQLQFTVWKVTRTSTTKFATFKYIKELR